MAFYFCLTGQLLELLHGVPGDLKVVLGIVINCWSRMLSRLDNLPSCHVTHSSKADRSINESKITTYNNDQWFTIHA